MNSVEINESVIYIANLTTNHYVYYEDYMKKMKEIVSKNGFWRYSDKIIIVPNNLNNYVEKEFGFIHI